MAANLRRSAHNNFTISPTPDLHIELSSNFDSGNLQSATFLSITSPISNSSPNAGQQHVQNGMEKQEEQQHQQEGEQQAIIQQKQSDIVKIQFLPALQPFNPQFSYKQSTKTFFHFSIKSSKSFTLHALVKRMGILSIIEGSNFQQYYSLCIGIKNKNSYQEPQYCKVRPEFMQLVKSADDYVLQWKYTIQANQKIYFAYHYPYSYEKLCHFLQDLDQNFKHSHEHQERHGILTGVRGIGIGQCNDIYYRNELLIQSVQGRQINLLTITQFPKQQCSSLQRQPRISKSLFPYYDIEQRPFKFNKPYIMLSSRVHPGETSASFAIEGFIRKLLGSSPQAEFLRKCFVFIIVPMINTDGVYNGMYRMDMQGCNLNRFYNNCAAHKQPAIFAINALLNHHSQDLVAFFDIHSHPQAKGSFMYGNAYTSIQDQIQSQLFAKLLSLNSESFSYQNCTFSQKNMNSKDINDLLTKDGSARVCAYKKMLGGVTNGVHCFALQLGYHGCPIKKQINKRQQVYQFKSEYRRVNKQFDMIDYFETGTDLIYTLAQVYIQTYRSYLYNQYPNQNNSINSNQNASVQQIDSQVVQQLKNCPLQALREEISKQVYEKDQRFKIMDAGLLKKIKNIQNVIFSGLYTKIIKKYTHILQNVKEYINQKKRKQTKIHKHQIEDLGHEKNIKVVHSLQLGKNHLDLDNKKIVLHNEQELRKFKQRVPPRDLKNIIFRSNKQKINVIPVQFRIPTKNISETRNNRRLSYNRILEMQADSLPKIDKKKLNFLTERSKLRQRRIQSSINTPNNQFFHEPLLLPVSRGSLERKYFGKYNKNQKMTLDSNIDNLIQYQNIINGTPDQQDQQQYEKAFLQAAIEYQSNFNPQIKPNLAKVRNQSMFQRQNTQKQTIQQQRIKRQELERNHQSERITRRLQTNQQRKRSRSKQKIPNPSNNSGYNSINMNMNINMNMHTKINPSPQPYIHSNQNHGLHPRALPKLGQANKNQRDRIHNKFDLQLKMKEKYDRQYRLDERLLKVQGNRDREKF